MWLENFKWTSLQLLRHIESPYSTPLEFFPMTFFGHRCLPPSGFSWLALVPVLQSWGIVDDGKRQGWGYLLCSLNIKMENKLFEDAFPIGHGGFPMQCWIYNLKYINWLTGFCATSRRWYRYRSYVFGLWVLELGLCLFPWRQNSNANVTVTVLI